RGAARTGCDADGAGTARPDAPASHPRARTVSAAGGAGCDQLADRLDDPVHGHPAQGLGRQPGLGRSSSAIGADVGLVHALAASAFGPGLPQSTPVGQPGGPGIVPVKRRVPTYAARPTLSRPPNADTMRSS